METLIIFGAKYLYLVVVAVAIIYILKQPREKQKRIILFAVVSLPLSYIVAKIGSWIYFDPRPFVVGNFTPLIPHVADNGFPSDHTLLTAAISSVIYSYNKKVGVLLWILTLAVGISRISAGIHHPIDILGSIIISILTTFVVYKIIRRLYSQIPANSKEA